mgnify:CR=1 FL=1
MSIPTYDKFIEPILRYLAGRTEGAPAREVVEAAADALGISEEDRKQMLPSGLQEVYRNRAGWGHDRLKRAGLSQSVRRGWWKLTPQGMEYARTHPAPLPESEILRLVEAYADVRLKTPSVDNVPDVPAQPAYSGTLAAESPDEVLAKAIEQIRLSACDDVLAAVRRVTPRFFERIVLDLLYRMGYGKSPEDLRRVGGVGDGGIDGVISLDRLGLEFVYVQAKRWDEGSTVGRPDVQAFVGALQGRQAKKGVFITTSTFTREAVEYARNVPSIVLIDGGKLAELMVQYEVGVACKTVKVPKLDNDYFDEELG